MRKIFALKLTTVDKKWSDNIQSKVNVEVAFKLLKYVR